MYAGTDVKPKASVESLYPFGLEFQQPLTTGVWASLRLDEGGNSPIFFDATLQGHHFQVPDGTLPEGEMQWAAGKVHEFCGAFTADTEPLESDHSVSFNPHTEAWSFVTWLYLETPAAEGTLCLYAIDEPRESSIKYLWSSGTLTFRHRIGYFAAPHDAVEFYNEVELSGLTAPLNTWYFVAAVYRRPNLLLRVNTTTNTMPMLSTTAVVPPISLKQDATFFIGPTVGRMDMPSIWINHALTDADLDALWAGGNGITIPTP